MGVCTTLLIEDLEEKDHPDYSTDEKVITDILIDIFFEKDSIIHTLAKKYNIDLSQFKTWPDDDILGPWQDPVKLMQSASNLHQAFIKEGNNLLEKRMFRGKIKNIDLECVKGSLEDIITYCEFAKERGKRVRFFIY
jgi:hypothetical protein